MSECHGPFNRLISVYIAEVVTQMLSQILVCVTTHLPECWKWGFLVGDTIWCSLTGLNYWISLSKQNLQVCHSLTFPKYVRFIFSDVSNTLTIFAAAVAAIAIINITDTLQWYLCHKFRVLLFFCVKVWWKHNLCGDRWVEGVTERM